MKKQHKTRMCKAKLIAGAFVGRPYLASAGWSVGPQMRFVKRVNERGVVTLPTEVREALGVDEGDIVEFEILGIARKASDRKGAPSKDAKPATGGNA
ncbi:MAG: Antidote-toxin recognition MazE, bacterial antitoxin [Thermoplasmata archaeon]|nr:Antidote-toxin recognition MazE, bacterial antitoxin [Thermoplasmata archaeon]